MSATSLAQRAVDDLRRELGEELHSCCLYGSTVREDSAAADTAINLLIVLRTSTGETQAAVSRAIGAERHIEPFVLGLVGLERSVRAFAAKFASIKRHYRVLHGADPLAGIDIAPELERFLCEQALRNLRLRLAHAFITRPQHRDYGAFLARSVTPLLLRLSEILRLRGIVYPAEMRSRVPVLAQHFAVQEATLRDLLALKAKPRKLDEREAAEWHGHVVTLLNEAVAWMEANWPAAARVV